MYMSENIQDEKLTVLEELLKEREYESNPEATDLKIYETWCDFLSNFSKAKDVRAWRNQIAQIDNYIEERKPGLTNKLKANALNNKYFNKSINRIM